ncbi:MAG: hypothetical protein JRH07_19500 [Deltaproteobacteria bacterium]|nr:hypothetical protein [Deltaproteobacteria bacterium]
MRDKPTNILRRRQKTLIRSLPNLTAVLRGSLIERYKRCGKPGCSCAQGRGHGPKYYLSVSKPGQRPEMDYVPQNYLEKVREHLDNFRKTKLILEELCEINRELLRRREKF